MKKRCFCRGTNESCHFCFGTGYVVVEKPRQIRPTTSRHSDPNARKKNHNNVGSVRLKVTQEWPHETLTTEISSPKSPEKKTKESAVKNRFRPINQHQFDAVLRAKIAKFATKTARQIVRDIVFQRTESIADKRRRLNKLAVQFGLPLSFSDIELARIIAATTKFGLVIPKTRGRTKPTPGKHPTVVFRPNPLPIGNSRRRKVTSTNESHRPTLQSTEV